MDCLVQQAPDCSSAGDNDVGAKDASERVTFLYHLCDGTSPKSYGVNVARLAGLPVEVLQLASRQSEAFLMVANKARNAGGANAEGNAVDERRRIEKIILYQRYFDVLVSLLRSVDAESDSPKLIPLVAELWNRFKHEAHAV
jgi:DNA mismatch repair ATPase MutS